MGALTNILTTLSDLEDKKTQREYQKKQQEFQENVQKPYVEALTRYQNALADNMASDLLDDSKRKLQANQALLTGEQRRSLKAQNDLLEKGLKSSDENERNAARDQILGIDIAKRMNLELNKLRTMFAGQEVVIHAMNAKSQQDAAMMDKMGSLLAIVTGNDSLVKQIFGSQRTDEMKKEMLGKMLGEKVPSKVIKGGSIFSPEYIPIGGGPVDANDPNLPTVDVNLEAQLEGLGG